MPQHRRKIPFSNKKKKDQIMAKRQSRSELLTNPIPFQTGKKL